MKKDCHECIDAYWGCFDKCPDYKVMTEDNYKPICKSKSNIFINPDTVSLWMLIIDDKPIFRTEFPHMITDEETKLLHKGSRDLLEVLEKNKNSSIDFNIHSKNIDNMLGKILKDIDWEKGLDG